MKLEIGACDFVEGLSRHDKLDLLDELMFHLGDEQVLKRLTPTDALEMIGRKAALKYWGVKEPKT